jgi:putative transposase
MKHRFIESHRNTHPVKKMVKTLGISRSGYYASRGRGETKRQRQSKAVVEAVGEIQHRVRHRYGSPRVTAQLRRQGMRVGHNRVARLMREHGLNARPRKKFVVTTTSAHKQEVAENLLNRQFAVAGPNRVWASDISYLPTAEGWLYLCVVLDLGSKRIVGWSLGRSLGTELVIRAFLMAWLRRRPAKGLLFHSDRGSQYCSDPFRCLLFTKAVIQSMSRKGNCWDNACVESFFKTLKTELVGSRIFRSREEARLEIFEYLEVFYNRIRLHSALDYLSPEEYELQVA